MQTQPDICRRKHGGDKNSEAANRAVAPSKQRTKARVESAVMMAREKGLTLYEFCDRNGLQPNAWSGRFSELHKEGRIKKAKEGRKNAAGRTCGAWVHVDHWKGTQP